MGILEFIESGARNLNIKEVGFRELYVRNTYRYLGDQKVKTIDIARVEAKRKGKGTFKQLVQTIRQKYPDLVIYVECVQTERFAEGLVKMGFVQCTLDPSFYLPVEGMSLQVQFPFDSCGGSKR